MKLEELVDPMTPVIVAGDFNSQPDSGAYKLIVDGELPRFLAGRAPSRRELRAAVVHDVTGVALFVEPIATGLRQPGYRHLVQPVPLRKIPWLAAAWGSTGHGDGGGCVGAVVAGGALVEG